ncbi:MAG: glycine cleavage system protein H [Desulfobacterota bacterium]|nr:glycine cleavage system protein H [Thermodesulfobacteriota bacterium]
MVFIFVVMTFIGAIVIGNIIRRRVLEKEASRRVVRREPVMRLGPVAAVPAFEGALQFPKDVYFHKGHAWAKPGEGNEVKVGLDDFTQQVMGDIEGIEVPPVGSQLKQGEVAWKLRKGKRQLKQLAPLGGTVVAVNEKVVKDPSLLNLSPYEKGWILKIRPKAFSEELPELMDAFQFEIHFDRLKNKFRSSLSHQSLGVVYGDGGELVRGAGGILEDRLWKILVTELFHTTPE